MGLCCIVSGLDLGVQGVMGEYTHAVVLEVIGLRICVVFHRERIVNFTGKTDVIAAIDGDGGFWQADNIRRLSRMRDKACRLP